MSRVFVARDLSLDREVVVKVLPPEAARKRLRELEESDVPAASQSAGAMTFEGSFPHGRAG